MLKHNFKFLENFIGLVITFIEAYKFLYYDYSYACDSAEKGLLNV